MGRSHLASPSKSFVVRGSSINSFNHPLNHFRTISGPFLVPSNVHIETTIAIVAVQPGLSLFSWSFLKVNIIKHRQHIDHVCPSSSGFIPYCSQRYMYRSSHLQGKSHRTTGRYCKASNELISALVEHSLLVAVQTQKPPKSSRSNEHVQYY